MIGINLLFQKKNNSAFHQKLTSGQGKSSIDLTPFITSSNFQEGWNSVTKCILPYEKYPVRQRTSFFGQYFIEGKIYNVTSNEVDTQLDACFIGEEPDIPRLVRTISGYSGEFVILISNATSVLIFNDSLGRLPVYMNQTGDYLFLGRSLYWLYQYVDLTIAPVPLMEFLWCSYPLAHKTLYENVMRIQGGSAIEINLDSFAVIHHASPLLNCDERIRQSLEKNSSDFTQLFLSACKNIGTNADDDLFNISLSGGQDSRAVSFGISRYSPTVTASSFSYAGAEEDVVIAEEVAALLHLPWKRYEVDRSLALDWELMKMKMGVNYTGLSFLLDYFHQLQSDHPEGMLLLTGDGGDKVLPYHGEVNRHLSLDALTHKIAYRYTSLPLGVVSSLLDISENDFLQHLHQILQSYPETSNNNKSIHFAIQEKVHQSFFEGEDRNRHFFWSTSPFYDLDVFRMAMNIEDEQKQGYRFYKHFMQTLSPSLTTIRDASGHTIDHPFFKIKKVFHEKFRATSPATKSLVRKLTFTGNKGNSVPLHLQNELVENLKHKPVFQFLLDLDYLASFLPKATRDQYLYLLTLDRLSDILKR